MVDERCLDLSWGAEMDVISGGSIYGGYGHLAGSRFVVYDGKVSFLAVIIC